MNKETVYEMLDEVFQDVFDMDDLHVNDNTTANDIEDWDSLEHINLVLAIERKFKIKFSMDEVLKFNNVGEMVDVILERVH